MRILLMALDSLKSVKAHSRDEISPSSVFLFACAFTPSSIKFLINSGLTEIIFSINSRTALLQFLASFYLHLSPSSVL